jgi:hypothetical protein
MAEGLGAEQRPLGPAVDLERADLMEVRDGLFVDVRDDDVRSIRDL